MTPAQQSLLDAITEVLQADTRIESAWLHGSLARDAGDEWSDIDVIAICAPGAAEDAIRRYVSDPGAIAPTVFANVLFGQVLNVVTRDWRRYDILFGERDIFSRFPAMQYRKLFNKTGAAPPENPPPPPAPPRPARVRNAIDEFLRILGLLPIVIGREEYVNALSGITHLRTQTINLMAEENGIEPWDRGGALHVNRLITPEQRAELESLGPIEATRNSIIEGHLAYARLFLPRARAVAEKLGVPWPKTFEDATRAHLERTLGVTF